MADEIASTIVVGRACVKHRLSYTDSLAPDGSHESTGFRLLREHERCVRQLPDEHRRDDLSFGVIMLCESVGMLRALFYESDTILYRYAFARNLMKYLLLIATFAAFIGTTPATSLAADCCRGNAKCCPGKCCKK
jgi:hypothetical protein